MGRSLPQRRPARKGVGRDYTHSGKSAAYPAITCAAPRAEKSCFPAPVAEVGLIEKQQRAQEPRRSFARERSVALERQARALYCVAVGIAVEPACGQSLDRPWQRASLDGLSADGERVVEIKCGPSAYQSTRARRRPPRHHVPQLQHILAVTGLPALDYWCYWPPHPPLRLEVRRDEAFIERLLAAEETFWRRMQPVAAQ